jgi:phage terminase small subunit
MALKPKRERFCLEYLKDLNATQAAIRAGYTKANAKQVGSELLSFLDVTARVEELKAAQFKRLQMSADEVLVELARIGRSDPRKLFDADGNLRPIHTLDDETAAALAGVDVVEVRSKIKKVKDPDEGDDCLTNTVEATKKIKLWDKPRALDILARHHGLLEKDNEQAGAAVAKAFSSDRDFLRWAVFLMEEKLRRPKETA